VLPAPSPYFQRTPKPGLNFLNDTATLPALYVPHDTKTGHFRDILPSQPLSLVLKKTKYNATKADMNQ